MSTNNHRLDELLGRPPIPKGKPFKQEKEHLRKSLKDKIHHRTPSLSPAEEFFLHALLVDESQGKPTKDKTPEQDSRQESISSLLGEQSEEEQVKSLKRVSRVLDDKVLFSVPDSLVENPNEKQSNKPPLSPPPPKAKRPSNHVRRRSKTYGLWQAHEEGVNPKSLVMRSSLHSGSEPCSSRNQSTDSLDKFCLGDNEHDNEKKSEDDSSIARIAAGASDDSLEYPSDVEVRSKESSEGSNWDESSAERQYNAWEILKDEYAQDFGYDYNHVESVADVLNGTESDRNTFKILGTSADDTSAQPHVLSPPLMDSLMSFLPDSLVNQNYWLKFSLARDGASLETLKQYSRASLNTILAIETDKGEVFGCFTSHSWRNHFGFYGGPPAFVWRMRNSRRTKCYSLFDQAHLESEIDVYMYTGQEGQAGPLLQVCRHDALAIGGDDRAPNIDDFEDLHAAVKATERMGFALALEDDLMIGTTSPSPSFSSPALCGRGNSTETFQVVNLEIWTFSPCMDVPSAERLEMTKFFIEESTHRLSEPNSDTSSMSQFSSRDFDQQRFYRRVGDDPEGNERRQRWQYLNMMNGTGDTNRGFGASPRFGYSS